MRSSNVSRLHSMVKNKYDVPILASALYMVYKQKGKDMSVDEMILKYWTASLYRDPHEIVKEVSQK